MNGFNFEKNLPHQTQAVQNTARVFDGLEIQPPSGAQRHVNPLLNRHDGRYGENIRAAREDAGVQEGRVKEGSNIIDIMMETGTGKTYTYAKTIFELNKQYGIFKFIVIVPTLSIKAGTIDFLKSDSSQAHFKEQYGKTLNLHIVASRKGGKKSHMPAAISSFAGAGAFDRHKIQVMIINAGMINSDTMSKSFDRNLIDGCSAPFDALAAARPFVIIDEPHKFSQVNKTWENIQKIKPQFILRYGATFAGNKKSPRRAKKISLAEAVSDPYENLICALTAVDAFKSKLIKGVIGHVTEFESGKNAAVRLVSSNGTEARFELNEGGAKKTVNLIRKDSLEKIHPAMSGLFIEQMNKSTVALSNGLDLKKDSRINPYSYAETVQEAMIKKAISNHFALERELLRRTPRIKPLTLFFIDNIDEYRSADGFLRQTVEEAIRAEAAALLETETDEFYKAYLGKTLADASLTHGGYFSRDNSEKDERIEREIIEILHDKQAMLALENPRRFIFSKWTLREGWDNPNVFQICKLRSSGSDISRLQEVGRGLRLPVNEYGSRVKDEQFYLHYFVDFTENDFVESLVREINEKSGALSAEDTPERMSAQMIKLIVDIYRLDEDEFIDELVEKKIIRASHKFLAGGHAHVRANYPLAFTGVDSSQVRKATDKARKISVRAEKYPALKALWEKISERVILEYQFKDEEEFKALFAEFLRQHKGFTENTLAEKTQTLTAEDGHADLRESAASYERSSLSAMRYDDFLNRLAVSARINIKTVHQAFIDAGADINRYLNHATIRFINQKFNDFLMYQAFTRYKIEYQKVRGEIHPTKLTDASGAVRSDVVASDIGLFHAAERTAGSYLLDELFYDSELERENIRQDITEVTVFTKIPKNSIKIPVAGGRTYSPDFAYVLNFKDGDKKLYFVVETKDVDEQRLRAEEKQKIRHAEKFFGDAVRIRFKTQFSGDKMARLISQVYEEQSLNS